VIVAKSNKNAMEKTEQREAILDAAFRCFARHGYRRTSLADIAGEAELSRPALYYYFRNKDDVFRALSQRINVSVVAAVTKAASEQHGDMEARLYAVLEARVSWAFDLLHASEYGRELIDEKNRLCGKASADTNARFTGVIERIIERGVAEREIVLSRLAMKASEAAAFIVDCLGGIVGEDVVTEQAARQRLRVLTRMFVGSLQRTGR
jgi:AcrR family transcriptional regulator